MEFAPLLPRPSRFSLSRQRARWGLIFVSPWLIGFVLLKFLPMVASLVISFTNFYALRPEATRFTGLANLLRLFADEEAFGALFATAGYALTLIPLQLTVSIGLAKLLSSRRLRGKSLFRALFFMPSIVPGAAVLLLWYGFLDPRSGWLNRLILGPLGLPLFGGLYSESGNNVFLTVMALWSVGPSFFIMLGAMQNVPLELYESARVDGAGPVYRFLTITLPMISPAILFSLVINLTTVFGGVTLLDAGNPFSSSASYFEEYMSQTMFTYQQIGYAATLAWAFFLVAMVITVALFASARHWVFYATED